MAALADRPANFVLVHGAWHGGWCYGRVADILRSSGHRVYTPTLTGLADRSHLFSADIGLQTHVDDIVKLATWEDLDDIILCGHSYGGMVITGAVEQLRDRVKALVYLDALVPDAGRSLSDYTAQLQPVASSLVAPSGDSVAAVPAKDFMVNEQDQAWVDAKCTPQPAKTFTDSLPSVTARDAVRRKFCVVAATYNAPILYAFAEARRSLPDWTVIDMPGGHDLMIDAPREVAEVLLRAAT
jgi:pimeloyl-ACP methyl ester carboxylesterase